MSAFCGFGATKLPPLARSCLTFDRLDVAQHMSLCRHYVRELHRSVLVSTPDLDKQTSKQPSRERLSEAFGDDEKGYTDDRRLSAFLRSEGNLEYGGRDTETAHSRNPTLSSSDAPAMHDTPKNVTRGDLRRSAERILVVYLLPGAEREIVLPPQILDRIQQAIEVEGRDDPEMFDEAKDYVFQAMEKDAFRGFLKAKALGNIVPSSGLLRLVVGLLGMFGGFWAAFCLIFLDIVPKVTRLWVCGAHLLHLFHANCNSSFFHSLSAYTGSFVIST